MRALVVAEAGREVMLDHGHDLVAGASADHEAGRRPLVVVHLFERRSSSASGRRRPRGRIAAEVLMVGGLIAFTWFERGTIERSLTFVHRADWKWLVVAGLLELASLTAFARSQQIILRATGVRIREASMLATTFAGNAISVSLPLIGPSAGTAFTFSRFRRQANDAASAGRALVISGLVSSLVWGVILAVGAAVSRDHEAIVGVVIGGAAILVAAIVGALSLRLPRVRQVTKRWVLRLVLLAKRMTGLPVGDPDDPINCTSDQLPTGRMSFGQWSLIVGLSILNWLANVGCLVAAIEAVGGGVPWTKLLLIYCAGVAASSFNLTPGGLGVVEGVMTAGLIAAGMRSAVALGSMLIYRLVTFWLVMLVGWTVYGMLRSARRHGAIPTSRPAPMWRHPYGRRRPPGRVRGLASSPPLRLGRSVLPAGRGRGYNATSRSTATVVRRH
jgi:putative heme transporter